MQILSQLKEGNCDNIKGVNQKMLEFITLLTCPNPKKRPTSLTIKQSMMKKIRQVFLSNAVLSHSVDDPDDSVYMEDLAEAISPAFQIECPVCLEILKQPVQVQCCGKNICSACIQRIQARNGPCPCCKKNEYNSFHNMGLEQSLDKIKFHCKFKSKGCSWMGELKERKKHIVECPKQSMSSCDSNPMENSSDVEPITGIFYSPQYVEQAMAIDWRGSTVQGELGIQLIIPENAIEPGDVVLFRIQVCSSSLFAIPDGLALESPMFHISPSYRFQSEVTLVIKHFACIERITEYEDWAFLSSPTTPKERMVADQSSAGTCSLWEFHPHGHLKFLPDSSQKVSVQLKHVRFACLARRKKKGKKI